MRLGSVHAGQIEFEDGVIAAFVAARARRRVELREAFVPALAAGPVESTGSLLETVTDDFLGPLRETVTASQRLGSGTRELSLSMEFLPVVGRGDLENHSRITTDILLNFALPGPVEWHLRLDESGEIERDGESLLIQLSRTTTLRIAGAPSSVTGTTVVLALPQGESTVVMTLAVGARGDVSDTVVVCRPGQMREAAILLAAIPDRRFVPLLVLAPPPTPLRDVIACFRGYAPQMLQTLSVGGGFFRSELALWGPAEKESFMRQTVTQQRARAELAPYRSWSKRNAMFRRALESIGARRAICLFEPTSEDLALAGIEILFEKADPTEAQLAALENLLTGIERTVIDAGHGLERVQAECERLFGPRPPPVEAEADDLAGVLLGLVAARRAGRPLRLVPGDGAGWPAVRRQADGATAFGHVVAVEVTGGADCLTAALYAAHVGSPLVTRPAPDLLETEACLRALQRAVVDWAAQGAARREGEAQRFINLDGLKAAFHRHVHGDWRPKLLLAIENAVARQVSAAFIDSVGDAALTVFGSGLPYSFVRAGQRSWSEKAIGHVISDPDLILLSEILEDGAIDPILSFNLIIDTGYFERSETDAVAATLTRGAAKSLILKKDAQIGALWLRLLDLTPIELLFFNTHGSDDSILIGNQPFPNALIPQWIEFRRPRPLIFNNSCLSWTGVGREFVRVGARGYVGTLWSVEANTAAEFAEGAMARMIEDGVPVSAALHAPGLDPITSRAYIYVGTATSRFAVQERGEGADDALRLILTMQAELALLEALRSQIGRGERDAFTRSVFAEFKALRAALPAHLGEGSAAIAIDAMLAELNLFNEKDDAILMSPGARLEFSNAIHAAIETLPAGDGRERRRARLLFLRAHCLRECRRYNEAIEDANAAAEVEARLGRSPRNARLAAVQTAIDAGWIEQALDLAEIAYSEVEERPPDAIRDGELWYELATLGRLCQIMKRVPDRWARGIELATRGIAIAETHHHRVEQATFETDLAHLLILTGEPGAALEAGQRALALARQSKHPLLELTAYGLIGQAHLASGDAEQARHYGEAGLLRAEELDEPLRVLLFLLDLARVEASVGSVDACVGRCVDLMERAARLGLPDEWQFGAGLAEQAVARSSDPAAGAALILGAAGSLAPARAELCVPFVPRIVEMLLRLGRGWPADTRIRALRLILGAIADDALPSDIGPEAALVRATLGLSGVILMIEAGETERALERAGIFDKAIGAGGSLIAALTQLIPKPPSA